MAETFAGYKRVLLPIDFTDPCTLAAAQAAWMVRDSGGVIHLAHVVVNPFDPIYTPQAVEHWVVVEHANEKAKEMLENFAASCLPSVTGRELHILGGDPYTHLIALAAKIQADLIVLSSHAGSGLAHLVTGVAEKVTRHAACPVLLVRVPK